MKQIRILRRLALGIAMAAGAGTSPALAQTGLVATGSPDADRLSQEMRVLAANPRDIGALLEAGTLSARLGDTSAALAFFARAETIDPTNPRILAGRASTLVRMERPGEALQLFRAAEARGVYAGELASDRGFAYDLLGQPGLAQNDYKQWLRTSRDDETVRRYALSLGITGDTEEAMRQLDALLRRSDRAAWRARAFILAMNGDIGGAERIAASMMPGNMGQSLAPFFRRLAALSPADRAFAVHFGELSPTPARVADARQAPVLPRYVPAVRPVPLAQAPDRAVSGSSDRRSRRSRQRDRDRDGTLAPAVRRPAPVEMAAAAPLPGPPVMVQRAEATPIVQPLPAPRAEELETPARQAPAPVRQPLVPVRQAPEPVQLASREAAPDRNGLARSVQNTPAAAAVGDTARSETVAPAARPMVLTPAATPTESNPAEAPAAAPAAAAPTPAAVQPGTPEPQPANAQPAPTPPGPVRVGQEDTVLASIVAGITIPAEELEVVTKPPVDPAAARAASSAAREAAAEPSRPAAKPKPEAAKPEPKKEAKKPEPAKPDPKAGKKGEPAKPDPKSAKKPDPKAKDPAKAEPRRIWVQVAGGANEASLAKAWKAAVAKAPAAFRGKSGWSTPLRATNRVLAGPFATMAEAQAFVNAIGKAGISGFVFSSEAGQQVTRLPN